MYVQSSVLIVCYEHVTAAKPSNLQAQCAYALDSEDSIDCNRFADISLCASAPLTSRVAHVKNNTYMNF